MKHPLRALGIAGFLATLGLLGFDAARRSVDAETAPPSGATPVPLKIQSLGSAEAAILGAVEMVRERIEIDESGNRVRIPTVRLRWSDPEPEGDSWLRGHDVEMDFYEDDGSSVRFTLTGPAARVALVPDADRPEIDTSQPWSLEQPHLVSENFVPGKTLELRSESASVHPETGVLETPGAFTVLVEGLELSGHRLRTIPDESALVFGGPGAAGEVTWSMTDENGRVYRGRSDDGGQFRNGSGDERILLLPARESSVLELPENASLPGRLESLGIELVLQPLEGERWAPTHMRGLVRSRWTGPNGWMRGGPWEGTWVEEGYFRGVRIEGPLLGFVQDDEPVYIGAHGGAWLEPRSTPGKTNEPYQGINAYLFGGAWIDNLSERIHAEWVDWRPHDHRTRPRLLTETDPLPPVAGGGIWLFAEGGAGTADRLYGSQRKGWALNGNAVVFPRPKESHSVAAPYMEMEADGRIQLTGGVSMEGHVEQGPWRLSAGELSARERRDQRRVHAKRDIVFELMERGLTFTGDDLLVLAGEREIVELIGTPARARVTLDRGLGRLEGAHMIVQNENLIATGRPVLFLPASALGLAGGEIAIHARRIARMADESWEITGGVTFTGALEGSAASLRGSAATGMVLTSTTQPASLTGTSTSTGQFRVQAERIELDPDGGLRLEVNTITEFFDGSWDLGDLAGTASSIKLTGSSAYFGPSHGWCEGGPVLQAGALRAESLRMDWEALNSQPQVLHLLGIASVHTPTVSGRADDIHYSVVEKSLRLEGSRKHPAELTLQTGRIVQGEWLVFDLVHLLVSGGQGRSLPQSQ